MEIKLNKDLSKLESNVFMGMNLRQTAWTAVGVALGVGAFWIGYRNGISTQTATWICMAAALPAAAMGFVTYHGLPFERLLLLWIRNYLMMPQKLIYRLENHFYERDKVNIQLAKEMEAQNDEKHT